MTAATLWTALMNIFFFFECYHFVTHAFILFRIRLLPRKDLVRSRYYFLIDTSCVFMVNIVLLQRLQLIAVCQIIQHLFYYITWDKSQLAKKVSCVLLVFAATVDVKTFLMYTLKDARLAWAGCWMRVGDLTAPPAKACARGWHNQPWSSPNTWI